MIVKVLREVLHCTACGRDWIPYKEGVPQRCPKPDCRKLATFEPKESK